MSQIQPHSRTWGGWAHCCNTFPTGEDHVVLIGHFGVALGIKRFAPGINLGILATAAVLPDLLWCSFLLLGWERSEVVPGITRFSPYDMQYVPWSHGLDSIVLYAAVTAIFAIALRRRRYEALWLSLA